ncbi:MAG: hypothetical protein V3R27_02790 [Pseudomonadales bacterium]
MRLMNYREMLRRQAVLHRNVQPLEPEVLTWQQYRNRQNLRAWRRKMGLA